MKRRTVLVGGASLGTMLLAGCTGESDLPGGTDGDATPTSGQDGPDADVGTFRLLISDQPTAIDEFDSLEVSFDRARIFRANADGEDEEGADGEEGDREERTDGEDEGDREDKPPTATATAAANATNSTSPTTTANATVGNTTTMNTTAIATETPEPEDGEQRGFFVIDLGGATVDLTQVVGDKAMGVFEGELPEGRYAKIELFAAEVGGIVDGDPVDVKIPSEKLQIIKPFEVTAGETLSFVFDITVVKKGQGGYNLLPVISESGVAGKDVPVEEVEPGAGKADDASGNESEGDGGNVTGKNASDGAGDGDGNGPPENESNPP